MPHQGTSRNGQICPTGPLLECTRSGHIVRMLPNNIAAIRSSRGLSQTDLAEAVGTTLNMLGKLERGDRKLTSVWIEKIAEALDVQPSVLLDQSAVVEPKRKLPQVHSDHAPTRRVGAGETVSVQRLDLSLAMGNGTNIDDHIEVDTVEFDRGFLRSITPSSPNMLRLVSGVGDSMFPTLIDTDMMFIDVGQRVLNMQDRIWGISLYGAGALKRLRAIGQGKVLVISDNPAVDNQEVDAEDITIAGRLVGAFRRH
jgi:phage repressor protein C with HTH and peptisase S24 domain